MVRLKFLYLYSWWAFHDFPLILFKRSYDLSKPFFQFISVPQFLNLPFSLSAFRYDTKYIILEVGLSLQLSLTLLPVVQLFLKAFTWSSSQFNVSHMSSSQRSQHALFQIRNIKV